MSSEASKKAYEQTLRRLQAIQAHLSHIPRSGRLSGKVCIVTGAGSPTGIGRATVRQYAHEGAKHIYALDIVEDHFEELKKTLGGLYADVKITTHACDAASEDAIREICERAITEQGQLDVFFANAAIATGAPISATDGDDVTETLRVNVLSCFHAVKYASEAMQVTSSTKPEAGGSIVLTASVAGLRSGAGSADYSASKAAVISLAQTGACQLAGTNIRVNAVCPGLIETGMTMPTFEMSRERGSAGKIGQLNPTRRYGVAEEIAQVVTFLSTNEASYVNGVALPVDGGLAASHPVVPGRLH